MDRRRKALPQFSPSFSYREGIAFSGLPLTCDGPGRSTDLIFISHANALAPRLLDRMLGPRAGQRKILTTLTTLELLGTRGRDLRSRALLTAFGRPFNLGACRLELIPTGSLPGAAGLYVTSEDRAFFYVGAFCPEPLAPALPAGEIRRAGAVCLDATHAHPRVVFPPRAQVLEAARSFALQAANHGKTPVFLLPPGTWIAVAQMLTTTTLKIRAHARFLTEYDRGHLALPDLPRLRRASGKIAPGETLFWPEDAWQSLALGSAMEVAWLSGQAGDSQAVRPGNADRVFPFTNHASHAELMTLVQDCEATEVALYGRFAEPFAAELLALGYHAYALSAPRQMLLLNEETAGQEGEG